MTNRIKLTTTMTDSTNYYQINEQRVIAKLIKGIKHWRWRLRHDVNSDGVRLSSYATMTEELDALDSLSSQSITSFPFRQSYFKHLTHQLFTHFQFTESTPLPDYPVYLVTIAANRDRQTQSFFRPIDFHTMEKRVHSILRGYHYEGFLNIGAFVYMGYGENLTTYRSLSPHYHLIVWGCNKKELRARP